MLLCEKLGMTLSELEERMTASEFDLWMTEFVVRNDECPACGHEVRDIGAFHAYEVTCPICKTNYMKIRAAQPIEE